MTTANEQALVDGFAALADGDPSTLLNLYSDDLTWAGWTFEGTQALYTKMGLLEALGVVAKLDDGALDIVKTEAVGDDIVIATVRMYRRLGEDVLDTAVIMAHRFTDGVVTAGADVCPQAFDEFWSVVGPKLNQS